MKRYYTYLLIVLLVLAAGLAAVLAVIYKDPRSSGSTDVLLLNEIAHRAADGTMSDDVAPGRQFVILDVNSKVLTDRRTGSPEMLTLETAVERRMPYTYIIKNKQIAGCVILTDCDDPIDDQRRMIVIGYCLGAVLILGASVMIGGYIRRTVIIPFDDMRRFASDVAAGDLDTPLAMDRENMFGAFSESFDIMREELRASRARELALQKKEREMVASLSHDLKTPITGIKLTSELMTAVFSQHEGTELAVPPDMTRKMENIYRRAEEINILVTDLFSSTLEDLGEFKVNCTDERTDVIAQIVSKHDPQGLVRMSELPEALVHIDQLRLSQVIGNIISNSYKYAGTPIDIGSRLDDGFLEMTIADSGPGVSEEETELITNKFYRGKEHGDKEGSGLGLYIAKILMEKMGGEISVKNAGGLCVTLLIPLS